MATLKRAIAETKEWLQLNSDPYADDEDAFDDLAQNCGQMQGGGCSLAGTEYCDWECPFS